MIKPKILSVALLAAVAIGLAAPFAHAQAINYSAGDLILGFEDYTNGSVNADYDYLVDLGPASYFINLDANDAPGTVVNVTTNDPAHDGQSQVGLGSLALDLSGTFGSNWAVNSATQGDNLQWGIIGATDRISGDFSLPALTFFLTIPETTPGQGSAAPADKSYSTQNQWNNNLLNLTNDENGWNSAPSTANNDYGAFEPNNGTDSWSYEIGGDTNSKAFGAGLNIEQPTDGSDFGPTNSELDLYELIPTTAGGPPAATELGTFTLNSSGTLDYTVVPEPSTYAEIGVGALLLLMFRRPRKTFRA